MKSTAAKVICICAALALAALAVADYLAWRSSQRRLAALAGESGLSLLQPEVVRELRRETVPSRAATYLAWSLLAHEVNQDWLARLSAAERRQEMERSIERLQLAQRLAREILPRRPASWQAATALGAASFLESQRRRGRESPSASWRLPLSAGIDLAPGHREPKLLLASAYLNRWSSLSPTERTRVKPLLSLTFEDDVSFDFLIPIWVRLAPSLSELLEPIPDRPASWRRLAAEFLHQEDLERYCVAHGLWLDSLPGDLDRRVEAARARLAGRARGWAVDILRGVVAAPARREHAESFAAALAAMPTEVNDYPLRRELHRWLSWALAHCPVTGCPLGAAAMAELGRRLPDLSAIEAAATALAARASDQLVDLQPGSGDEYGAEWDRYWIELAELRRIQGDATAARQALDRLPPSRRDDPRYWRAVLRLAEDGDEATAELAGKRLRDLSAASWPATAWKRRGSVFALELWPERAASGVALRLRQLPERGGAVELHWDGRLAGVFFIAPGEELIWRSSVSRQPHLLEIIDPTGAGLVPGDVTLLPAALG